MVNTITRWAGRGLALLLLTAGAQAGTPATLRVGVLDRAVSVTVDGNGWTLDGKPFRVARRGRGPMAITSRKNNLYIDGKKWGKTAVIRPREISGTLRLGKRAYRGFLELHGDGNGIQAVNIVSVEDYVRGVLQMETSDRWPEQALKTQAVISRTYALRNRGRHGRSGYDFCDGPHCQAYGGANAERARTNGAVRDTEGEVVVDLRGRLISAVFHSSCGGFTESAEHVWATPGQPYLESTRCPWCRDNPHAQWMARVEQGRVDRGLEKLKMGLGGVKAIGILSHTPSGRVGMLRVYGEKKTVELSANRFRIAVDPNLIRSTFWSGISKRDGVWQIHGRGWGHGVGLCQWGMKELAEKNLSYGQILRYYYDDVEVKNWR